MSKPLFIAPELRPCIRGNFRAASSGSRTVSGYASLYNVQYDVFDFKEQFARGAFRRVIAERQDVRFLINHDPSKILGRIEAGTLKLSEDSTGLRFTCSLPQTSYASDLLASITRGDLSQCSIGFGVPANGDRWDSTGNGMLRTIMDCDLYDCSVVTYPASPTTTIAADRDEDPECDPDSDPDCDRALRRYFPHGAPATFPLEVRSRLQASAEFSRLSESEQLERMRARLDVARLEDMFMRD